MWWPRSSQLQHCSAQHLYRLPVSALLVFLIFAHSFSSFSCVGRKACEGGTRRPSTVTSQLLSLLMPTCRPSSLLATDRRGILNLFLTVLRAHVPRHTSHVTCHTSHVTRHTSHVTRITSHVTRHTSHVTRHTSHVTHGTEWKHWHRVCSEPLPLNSCLNLPANREVLFWFSSCSSQISNGRIN
jgi:hypothetical protein